MMDSIGLFGDTAAIGMGSIELFATQLLELLVVV